MADPITIGITLAAVSAGVGAIGAIQSAQANRDAANHNRDIANRNALISRQQGEAQALQLKRDQMRRMGAARANVGASGVAAEGSALDVLEESAFNAEMDQMTLKYNTQLRMMGFGDQASQFSAEASNAMSAGYMKAGSALLTGASSIYGMTATSEEE